MPTLIPANTPFPEDSSFGAPSPRGAVSVVASVGTARRTGAAKADGGDEITPRYRASGPISKSERQELGMVSKQAWEKCGAKAAGIPSDEWRFEQVAIATDGKAGRVSEVTRGQFREVLAHFLLIKGDVARAFQLAQRSGQKMADRDLAYFKLREVCEWAEYAYPDYPEEICWSQFKVPLDAPEADLPTGRIWFLFYTCTANGRRKKEKAAKTRCEGPTPDSAVVTLENGSDAGNPVGGPGERQV